MENKISGIRKEQDMKLISWNVNGLRACLTHDFAASFAALDADIFSVQETKMQPGQADFAPEGYTEYTYSAEKKGYSGTAFFRLRVLVTAVVGFTAGERFGFSVRAVVVGSPSASTSASSFCTLALTGSFTASTSE